MSEERVKAARKQKVIASAYSAFHGHVRERTAATMATPPTESSPTRKLSPYLLSVLLGAAGVILLVLGFILGLTWLALVGFLLFISAAASLRTRFFLDWRPSLVKVNEHDEDPWHILPPPTREDRS